MPFQWVHNASPEVNEVSQWPVLVGVCITLTVMMACTVGLRLYVRAHMLRAVGIDDYIIVFSAICSIIYSGICIGQSRWGLGLPLALRPQENLNQYSQINFAGRPFYMAGITGFKVALCFAYLRITSTSHHSQYRNFIWSLMAFSVLTHLGGTLVLIFQCSPMKKSWRPKTPGKCLDSVITFYVLAGITILCDLITFFAPIPLLLRVQINTRKKIGLIAVFTLGAFTTVCSVMRMIQIITMSKNGNTTMLVLWGTIEMNVGIFLTCLPSLIPMFSFFGDKVKQGANYHFGPNTYGSKNKNIISTTPMNDHNDDDNKNDRQRRQQRISHSMPLQSLSYSRPQRGHDTRSDSQENILPSLEKVMTKEQHVITKTTVVEVQRYAAEGDSIAPLEPRW